MATYYGEGQLLWLSQMLSYLSLIDFKNNVLPVDWDIIDV